MPRAPLLRWRHIEHHDVAGLVPQDTGYVEAVHRRGPMLDQSPDLLLVPGMVQLTVLPAYRAHGGSASAHLPMDTLPAANHVRVAHFHRQLLPARRCNPTAHRTRLRTVRRSSGNGMDSAHEERGLKHRPANETRPVPIPPELVATPPRSEEH